MSMEQFYSKCGEFISYRTRAEGSAPHRRHIVDFYYFYGIASFDGVNWWFQLNTN